MKYTLTQVENVEKHENTENAYFENLDERLAAKYWKEPFLLQH